MDNNDKNFNKSIVSAINFVITMLRLQTSLGENVAYIAMFYWYLRSLFVFSKAFNSYQLWPRIQNSLKLIELLWTHVFFKLYFAIMFSSFIKYIPAIWIESFWLICYKDHCSPLECLSNISCLNLIWNINKIDNFVCLPMPF